MTAKINGNTATATVNGDVITVKIGDEQMKLNVKEITSVTDVLLAARKQALKKTRDAAKAKRATANAAKAAKLRERLAKLEAATATA